MIETIEYKIDETDIQELLEKTLYHIIVGYNIFSEDAPSYTVDIKTGLAGMMAANRSILECAEKSGLIIDNKDDIIVRTTEKKTIDNIEYDWPYTTYMVPFLANVRFSIDPSLDNVYSNDALNPMTNGFRLTSYSYLIENSLGDSIKLIGTR